MNQTVPLSTLTPSKVNPRRRFDPVGIEQLAVSMATDGVLQNLVVRCRRKDRYEVLVGERRYRALKLRQSRGEIDGDYPVPVEVRHGLSALEALRIATVENIQRENLDAIEEADAFAAMLAKGGTLDDIAAQTGISDSTIKRRLALASLCDEAKQAVREGQIGLGIAEALTLGSHDQQRELLEQVEDGTYWHADDIRACLTGERPTLAMAIFDPVFYTGTLTTDLFGEAETTYFDDVAQFHQLQRGAVETLAAQKRDDGADFAEVIEGPYLNHWHYRPADEDETGGVVILLTPSGRVELHEGVVREEHAQAETIEATRPTVAAQAPRERPEYSAPLVRYIAHHKSAAVQAAVFLNPRKALELAVVQMLNSREYSASRLTIDPHPCLAALAKGETPSRAYEAVEAQAAHFLGVLGFRTDEAEAGKVVSFRASEFARAWDRLANEAKEPVSLYEAVKRLSDADLAALHALLVALSFGQEDCERIDDRDSLFNRVARDLDIDMRDWWRPDAVFLAGRTRDQLHGIAIESGATMRMGRLKEYKKTGLVAALTRYFAQTATLSETPYPTDIQGRNWLPAAMGFGPDRSEDHEPEPPDLSPAQTPDEEPDADEPAPPLAA